MFMHLIVHSYFLSRNLLAYDVSIQYLVIQGYFIWWRVIETVGRIAQEWRPHVRDRLRISESICQDC